MAVQVIYFAPVTSADKAHPTEDHSQADFYDTMSENPAQALLNMLHGIFSSTTGYATPKKKKRAKLFKPVRKSAVF